MEPGFLPHWVDLGDWLNLLGLGSLNCEVGMIMALLNHGMMAGETVIKPVAWGSVKSKIRTFHCDLS